jgi:hypothetical protein
MKSARENSRVLHGQHPCGHAHFGQGTVDQVLEADQAAVEHGAGRTRQTHVAGTDDGQRQDRSAQVISHLVREVAKPFVQRRGLEVRSREVPLIGELGDGIGDGVVQASVEGAEFIHLDPGVPFERQIGDRLAGVPVVVHQFFNGIAVFEQLAAMRRSCFRPFPTMPAFRHPLLRKPGDCASDLKSPRPATS